MGSEEHNIVVVEENKPVEEEASFPCWCKIATAAVVVTVAVIVIIMMIPSCNFDKAEKHILAKIDSATLPDAEKTELSNGWKAFFVALNKLKNEHGKPEGIIFHYVNRDGTEDTTSEPKTTSDMQKNIDELMALDIAKITAIDAGFAYKTGPKFLNGTPT